jgi:hypothetical protein
MSETILKAKSEHKPRVYKYAGKNSNAALNKTRTLKSVLTHLIVNQGVSIDAAAISCDLDTDAAKRILFSRKPTTQQIDKAIEIYEEGLSLTVACASSGVSVEHFRKAKQERPSKKYKPLRW